MGFQHVSDLCAKMEMWHLTADEVIQVLKDIMGDGVESKEENVFGEEEDAEFDPASVNGSDSDCPGTRWEESVEVVNEPSTSRGRRCGCGRKMQY